MQRQRNQHLGVPTALLAGRAVLAVVLLLSVLSAVVPFATALAAPTCKLVCCIGKAAHPAGSCMGGACETAFPVRATTTHHEFKHPTTESDHLCGATHATSKLRKPRLAEVTMVGASSTQNSRADGRPDSRANRTPEQSSVSSAAVMRPCNPDCGSCASGSTGNKRPRNIATLSYADRARPPTPGRSPLTSYVRIGALSTQCPQLLPRAPPVVLS